MDSDGEDTLLGERVEVDPKIVHKKMESVYANFTLVPPSSALEVELFHLQLR